MSAVLPSEVEILPRLTPVAAAVAGPGQVVIDNETQTISFEHKSATLLLAEAVAVHAEASDLAPCIDSEVMYGEAAELLKMITDSFKTLDEKRLATTKPLRDKVDQINTDYKPAIEKRKEAADILKGGMLGYEAEVERKRQIAEAEARARAEAERRRAEAEARAARERAEAEAREAREQAEARAAEERRIADENAQRMRAEAEALEATGDAARAAQLLADATAIVDIAEETAQTALFEGEQIAAGAVAGAQAEAEAMTAAAQMMTPAAPAISRPRAAGVSTRKVYACSIVDAKAALAHVLANWDTCNHLVELLQAKFDRLASDQKERFSFPGCELQIGNSIASRRH